MLQFFIDLSFNEKVTISIALFSLFISGFSLYKNQINSKAQTEIALKKMLSNYRFRLNKAFQSEAVFLDSNSKDPLTIQIMATANEAIDIYLSAFDEACSKHFNGDIRTDYLTSNYKHLILDIFNDPRFKDHLEKEERYLALKKFKNTILMR